MRHWNRNAAQVIVRELENKPIRYSFFVAVAFVSFVPTVSFICWEGCTPLYMSALAAISVADMAILIGAVTAVINLLAVFVLVRIFLALSLRRRRISSTAALILLAILLLFIALMHNIVFYHFTYEGKQIKGFEEKIDSTLSEVVDLKTKHDVVSYIESQKDYREVVCSNTKLDHPFIDALQISIKPKDLSARGGPHFCNTSEKLSPDLVSTYSNENAATDLYYDCIVYYNAFTTKFCFVDDQTKYISINAAAWSREHEEKFVKSYFDGGLTIQKYYCSYYSRLTSSPCF